MSGHDSSHTGEQQLELDQFESIGSIDAESIETLQNLTTLVSPSLESLSPQKGVERFLAAQENEVTSSTLSSYETKLEYFVSFCVQNGVDDLNDLSGRDIEDYRLWRRDESSDGELSRKTMRDEMYLLRQFLRYLESIEAVKPNLNTKVRIPDLSEGDGVRDEEIAPERVTRILDHLEKYRYATREHVVWVLFCRTGRRLGGIRSIDLCDLHLTGKDPYIEFTHRENTRLKNKEKSEEKVNIPAEVAEILQDYLDINRVDVSDDQGREPLLTSQHGRLSESVLRKYLYKWSRPCKITGDCPVDREEDSCEAARNGNTASKCPSSKSPHTARHGHITELRRKGVPIEIISERCDVSEEVIKKHYDERDDEEKRELRRELLEEVIDLEGGYL